MSAANLITSLLENVFFADVGYTLHRVIFMSVRGFFYFMYEKYRLSEFSYAQLLHYGGSIKYLCLLPTIVRLLIIVLFPPSQSNLLVTVQSRVQYMFLPGQIKRGVEMTIAVNSPCFYTLAVCQVCSVQPVMFNPSSSQSAKNTKNTKRAPLASIFSPSK